MSRARKINREEVLEAAFAQIAEGGLDSLSMRGLGHRLGVEAMTLYGYVGSKEDLLEGLRAELFRQIPTQTDSARPRRDLEEICLASWRALTRKPGTQQLLAGMKWPTEDVGEKIEPTGRHKAPRREVATWLPLAEAMLRPLTILIPEALDRAYAFRVLFSFVIGQVMASVSTNGTHRSGQGGARDHAAQFPEFSTLSGVLAESSADLAFELGLRALLDAIEQRSAF